MTNDRPDGPNITASENGPYVVSGGVPLIAKTPIETTKGEPIAWATSEPIQTGKRYLLCRCGGSARKPFCDGTHKRIGFRSEDSPTAAGGQARPLKSAGITVLDDRSLCAHASFCGTAVTDVWKLLRKSGDTAIRSQIIAMIERCPSGALAYLIDEKANEPDLPKQVGVIADGPLWVMGGIPAVLADGTPLPRRNRVTLCRCGASKQKPYCDGTHKEIGFQHQVESPVPS